MRVKIFLCFILLCILSVLIFLNIKAINGVESEQIIETIELTNKLSKIYSDDLSLESLPNNSAVISFYDSEMDFLTKDRLLSYTQIKNLSIGNNSHFDVEELYKEKNTEYTIIDDEKYIRLSNLENKSEVIMDDSVYLFDSSVWPTIENLRLCPDYTFIFNDVSVEGNTVNVEYLSLSKKDTIVYQVDYNVFGDIEQIVLEKGDQLLCLGV